MDLDLSHPAVRDYLALVRLQVLTPLSLLINVAAVVLAATIASPTIQDIARLKPTAISPKPSLIAPYLAVIYAGQIGYCLLLVLARKPETKRALIKAVGLVLVLANCIMAAWAAACVFQWFLAATILQGLLLLLLLYSNIALLVYHPPTSARPLDTALIHAPLRFFLVLPLSIMFPYFLFITLHLTYHPTPSGPPVDYAAWHAWSGFAAVMATNLVGLLVVLVRRDIVWCVAATWLCISIWSQSPKPAPVYITVMTFTALHPLALFASLIYAYFYAKPSTPLALHGQDGALYANAHSDPTANPNADAGTGPEGDGRRGEREGPAREVDVEALWG